ncbi:Isochorismate synthase/isochorismate lyase [Streptomyces sp. PTY087I2]|nr:Isochorismate synthase/isochorismate lyase [Streptomyces sp. PTY087I2]
MAAALAAESTDAYVLYENREEVCWAEGEAAAVEVDATGVWLECGGERSPLDTDLRPLAAAGQALAEMGGADWRAYGWATFELATSCSDAGKSPGPLARLFLPRAEIRFGDGVAVLRAQDEKALDAMVLRLAGAESRPAISEGRIEADVDFHGADAYRQAVAEAVREIRQGALDKVILSREVPVPGEIDLPATYVTGRRNNDPARSFLLRLGEWEAAGFSPEIVARVTAEGEVNAQPLAGTRALVGEPAVDDAARKELLRDAKEVFEHAISVRLAAEELAEVCEDGTVRVAEFMSVRERGSVQHLASYLVGSLREGATSWDAFATLFPAITASGIPKKEACERIRLSEKTSRGLYSGAVIMVDGDGTLDAALVLRSVYRRAGRTWLRAGAGVVAQSDPERELEETREKLRSVGRFLVPAVEPVHSAS